MKSCYNETNSLIDAFIVFVLKTTHASMYDNYLMKINNKIIAKYRGLPTSLAYKITRIVLKQTIKHENRPPGCIPSQLHLHPDSIQTVRARQDWTSHLTWDQTKTTETRYSLQQSGYPNQKYRAQHDPLSVKIHNNTNLASLTKSAIFLLTFSRRIEDASSTRWLCSLLIVLNEGNDFWEQFKWACYCTHKLLVMLIFLTQPSSFIGLYKCRWVKIICSPNSHVTQVENIPPQAGVKSATLANNWELLALETRNL